MIICCNTSFFFKVILSNIYGQIITTGMIYIGAIALCFFFPISKTFILQLQLGTCRWNICSNLSRYHCPVKVEEKKSLWKSNNKYLCISFSESLLETLKNSVSWGTSIRTVHQTLFLLIYWFRSCRIGWYAHTHTHAQTNTNTHKLVSVDGKYLDSDQASSGWWCEICSVVRHFSGQSSPTSEIKERKNERKMRSWTHWCIRG